jgi:putative hemolysin
MPEPPPPQSPNFPIFVPMDGNVFIILGISLFFTAFFSGMEIAFLTANRMRIELSSKKGVFSARILSFFIKRPSHFFTTTLVGNNVAVVLFSITFAALVGNIMYPDKATYLLHEHDKLLLLIQTVAGSFIVLIIGEFLPKAFFRTSPNLLLNILSAPFILFYYMLYPLVMLIVFLAQIILKIFFNTKISSQEPEFTRHDLFHYVSESSTADEESSVDVDKEIFRNAIDFPFVKVRDCMTPRTEIAAVEIRDGIETVKQRFIESGHSKLLVYRDSIDNVTGYIHLVDLYGSPSKIEEVVMPIVISSESMPVTKLMQELVEKRRSIAVVVDEFGGTSGLITMEDIIEEIIGEIEDEHDVLEHIEKKINDNEYIFSARLHIDYLNEEYDLKLPKGDYETLGGLIFYNFQNIPKEGDIIEVPRFEFTVLSTDQARLKEVRVKIVE